MIQPVLKDSALLEDIAGVPEDRGGFHLWWLGQSGFLLKWGAHTLLLDPYLSDSLTQKYSGTDKEHIRMTQRCIAPEALGFVEVITSSHAHTDHFDANTLMPLSLAHEGPLPLILPRANLGLAAERLSGSRLEFQGINAGETLQVGEFGLTAIPSAHDTIEYDEHGCCRFLGFIIRFGPWTIYHSGDTRWYDELPTTLAENRPDVALLPINGHDPARRVAGNLDGAEAAKLAHAAGAGVVIPHHFEMFTFNSASPELFRDECQRVGQAAKVLRCGERWSSPAS